MCAALVMVPLSGRAEEPLVIHAIFSQTGAIAFVGKESATSLKVAEDTVNRSGGIGGRPINFIIHDDESNPRLAVQIANDLLAKGVPVVLGPIPVASCNAVAPLLRRKAVMYCNSAAFRPEPGSYAFTAGVSTMDQFVFAVHYLRLRGITKIASMTSNDASGEDADRGIKLALSKPENKEMSLLTAEHFNPSDISVNAQMVRIKAAGAEALFTSNSGTQLGVILHAYVNLGLTIPVVASAAALNYTTVTQFASILPKEFLVAGVLSDAPAVIANGPEKAAVRIYTDAFKAAGIEPDHALSVNWDPVMILVAAFRKLGPNATAAQINHFIEDLHGWHGTAGGYDFRNGNQSGLNPSYLAMVRWNADKKTWVAASKLGGTPLNSQ
jgi:branched-chain amino acid transport system substrate-binding protein